MSTSSSTTLSTHGGEKGRVNNKFRTLTEVTALSFPLSFLFLIFLFHSFTAGTYSRFSTTLSSRHWRHSLSDTGARRRKKKRFAGPPKRESTRARETQKSEQNSAAMAIDKLACVTKVTGRQRNCGFCSTEIYLIARFLTLSFFEYTEEKKIKT